MATTFITQEYYDELCLENADVFGLNEEEAVTETEQQLAQSSSSLSPEHTHTKLTLDHLSRTFPTCAQGVYERQQIQEFCGALLVATTTTTTTTTHTMMQQQDCAEEEQEPPTSLGILLLKLEKEPILYLSVWYASNGFQILVPQTNALLENRMRAATTTTETHGSFFCEPTIVSMLKTLRVCLEQALRIHHFRKHDLLVSFQTSMGRSRAFDTWIGALETESKKPVKEWNVPFFQNMLVLIWYSVKQCESNKVAFMNARSSSSSCTTTNNNTPAPTVLVSLIHKISQKEQGSSNQKEVLLPTNTSIVVLGRILCRLVMSLCTFEPSLAAAPTQENGGGPPNVSSAHSNVLTLHQQGLIPGLSRLLVKSSSLEPFVILALRAMAIHNDVVKSIVSVGLLQQVRDIFVQLTSRVHNNNNNNNEEEEEEDSNNNNSSKDSMEESAKDAEIFSDVGRVDTLVATVGFFRNMCANDDIKTSLCLGGGGGGTSESSIVEALVDIMGIFLKTEPVLQEHGCGVIAAMALRKPNNARALVLDYQAHVSVIGAMRAHPHCATLQRQACLALRNLVCRSPEELRPALSQAGAEQALLQIAAHHGSCQDEVYAALRDMGVNVGIVTVVKQSGEDDGPGGGGMVVKHTEMFGETKNPNFRPVFD